MPASDLTLEQFRAAAAGQKPTPAGVAVAAASASLAFALLAKVLLIGARRKDSPAASARLEPLIAAAQAESKRMLQLAEQDMAAVEACLASQRMPRATQHDRERRREAFDAAVRQAIDLPLAAARAAAAGLQMSGEVLTLTPLALVADLGSVASLLSGALRTFLVCAQSNVRLLAPGDSPHRDELASAVQHSRRTLRQADELLERIAAALGAAARPGAES